MKRLGRTRAIAKHTLGLVSVAAVAIGVATLVAWTARHGVDGASIRLCTVPIVESVRGGADDCIARVAESVIDEDAVNGLRMVADYERDHQSPLFRARCHVLMHGISRRHATIAALRRIDELDGLSSCVDGFVHGGIDAVLGEGDVEVAEVLELANSRLCPEDPLWRTRSCQHGFGHSLMRRSGNDMRRALEDCSRLGDDGFDASCAGGAMMEYTFAIEGLDDAERVGSIPTAQAARARCDDLLSPAHRWHGACVGWIATTLDQPLALDTCDSGRPTSADCRTLIGYNMAQRGMGVQACDDDGDCLSGFATMALSADREDPSALGGLCADTSEAARRGCVKGGGVALRLGSGTRAAARKACRSAVASSRDHADCVAGVDAGETASWMM